MPDKDKTHSDIKKERLDKRWAEQIRLGIHPPKNEEERLKRLKEAHGY